MFANRALYYKIAVAKREAPKSGNTAYNSTGISQIYPSICLACVEIMRRYCSGNTPSLPSAGPNRLLLPRENPAS